MANKKSALKALRQTKKRTLKNVKAKRIVKDLSKVSNKLIQGQDKSKAGDKVKEAIKKIDKAIQKKILKKNTGARKKSRLVKKLNSLK